MELEEMGVWFQETTRGKGVGGRDRYFNDRSCSRKMSYKASAILGRNLAGIPITEESIW